MVIVPVALSASKITDAPRTGALMVTIPAVVSSPKLTLPMASIVLFTLILVCATMLMLSAEVRLALTNVLPVPNKRTDPGIFTMPFSTTVDAPLSNAASASASTARLVNCETLSKVTAPVPALKRRSKPPLMLLAPALLKSISPAPAPLKRTTSPPRITLVASLKSIFALLVEIFPSNVVDPVELTSIASVGVF